MTFKEGDRVIYKPERESGTVLRTNERWVFVLYDGDKHGKATHPRDLEHEHD